MRCRTCGEYFKQSIFNPSAFCDSCYEAGDSYSELDQETEVDMYFMQNPNGRVQPKIDSYDSYNSDEGFGF